MRKIEIIGWVAFILLGAHVGNTIRTKSTGPEIEDWIAYAGVLALMIQLSWLGQLRKKDKKSKESRRLIRS